MKLRIIPIQDLSTLQTLLLQQIGTIQGQIQIVEAGLNTEWGSLILGIDQEGRLSVFMTGIEQEEGLLTRLIGVYGWVSKNLPLLSRVYAKQGLDGTRLPRVIAVAPAFSKTVLEGLGCLTFGVELYLYRGLEVEGEPRILLEPVGDRPSNLSSAEVREPTQSFVKGAQLTEAEVRFFEANHPSGPTA